MVTMAHSAANWSQHVRTLNVDQRTHPLTHSHTYINTVYNHVARSSSSAVTEFGIQFVFLRYLREGGANQSTLETTRTQQPAS